MKKINYRKLFVLFLWISSVTGLLVSLGFASAREKDTIVRAVQVNILNDENNHFLTAHDVLNFFEERSQQLVGKRFHEIDVPGLEKLLNSHPSIANAEVSRELDGSLTMNITQREPVLRIINRDGESYYIDSENKLMPLSENYSARVLVASGEIIEPYARRYQFSVEQIAANKTFSEVSLLDDLLAVARHVNADSSLSALIQHIHVNAARELELYPAIGDHRIIFGSANDIDNKFRKLKVFYSEGLSKSDAWKKYSTVNLKFKDLVVCTKK